VSPTAGAGVCAGPADQRAKVAKDLVRRILRALADVDDPEYPGVSIVDLGLLERLDVDERGAVRVGLVPTFTGCPALAVIAAEAEAAAGSVDGVSSATVQWLMSPVWSVERVSGEARAALARSFTVAVPIGGAGATCPRCDSPTREQSRFGPSRCRSVHRCDGCGEVVEVLRS